jgi:hypothetical protein
MYRVGNLFTWSKEFSFDGFTPGSADSEPPRKLAVFGDWGSKNEGLLAKRLLTQHASEGAFDAVLHLGDIAYNLYSNEGRMGDDFGNDKQEVAARRPYMTIPGNHEIKNRNGTHYKARYHMPVNDANDG